MSVGRIATRYAKSLLDLAIEQNQLEDSLADIQEMKASMASQELVNFFKSPVIKSEKKLSVYKAIFGDKFKSLADKFFQLVIKKGREDALPEICDEFIHQYKEHKGISAITIVSATKMTAEAEAKVKQRLLESNETYANVDLDFEIDESLIGGFKIKMGGKLYDASVAHKLEQLRKEFSN